MKLFLIRFTKIAFIFLRLHVIFNLFNGLFLNLVYLTKFSAWIRKNKGEKNDFPSKWDYNKRYEFYDWVIKRENLHKVPVSYLEFGVAHGISMKWFIQQNTLAESRYYGFDTFTGLPEDYGPFKKGAFSSDLAIPEVNDNRVSFYQGLFQQTLPGFTASFSNDKRNVIMMDADLYSASLYALSMMRPFLKKGDVIFFDEFAVPTHEFRAYLDFIQSYYIDLELIGAANNYYFVAFRVL